MLMAMRRGAAGWVAKILFGLLILSFAAWGIGDYLTPDANPVVAEVGEIEIRRTDLDRAERRQLDQMRRLLGQAFNPDDLPENALRSAALEQLIGQTAMEMEARALGLSVSETAIAEAIRANPQFADNGVFDPATFRRTLFIAGMTEDSYVAALRSDLARVQLTSAVAAVLPPPLPVAEALYQVERQQRDIAYVQAETGAIETPKPSDDDLRAYISENAERYAEPERRVVRAIIVSQEAVYRATEVSDADVEARYEATKSQLERPERRRLAQALFQSEAEAQAFRSTAPTELDVFQNLAEIAGADVTDLGELAQIEIFPKALGDVVFAAQANAATQPVQTALGWHVVLVAEVVPAGVATLDEVRDELRDAIRAERAEHGVVERANAMEDALAAGGDLEEASRQSGLPVTTFDAIDAFGRDADGAAPPNLPADGAFLEAAFSRDVGDQSGLIELDGGVFTAMVVDSVIATAPKAFETVRAEAEEAWRTEKRLEIAEKRMSTLAGAKSLGAFEAAAKEAGLAVEKTGLMRQDQMQNSAALGVAYVEQLFNTPANTVASTEKDGAVLAAFVAEVQTPTFDPSSSDGADFLKRLATAQAGERVEALGGVARNAHPPSIPQNALERFEPPQTRTQ